MQWGIVGLVLSQLASEAPGSGVRPRRGDACSEFSQLRVGMESRCSVSRGVCEGAHWDSTAKHFLVMSTIDESVLPELVPVECSEASAERSLVKLWQLSNSVDDAVGDFLNDVSESLLPGLSEQLPAPIGSVFVRILKKAWRVRNFPARFRGLVSDSPVWAEWIKKITTLLGKCSVARLADHVLVARAGPFLHLHRDLTQIIFGRDAELTNSHSLFLVDLLASAEPIYKRNTLMPHRSHPGNTLIPAETLGPMILARLEGVNPGSTTGLFTNVLTDRRLLDSLDAVMELIYDPDVSVAMQQVCPSLARLVHYVSWLRTTVKSHSLRIIVSLADFCKPHTSLETRMKLIPYLSPSANGEYRPRWFEVAPMETVFDLQIPSTELVEASRSLVELSRQLRGPVRVSFTDSPATGDGVMRQWIQALASEYLGRNWFEFTDEHRIFRKPLANAVDSDLLMIVGRIIGLGIRYSVPVGARLGPCALSLFRLPNRHFDLGKAVEAEDPMFARSLEALRSTLERNDREMISNLYPDLEGTDEWTRESADAEIRNRLRLKCTGSITRSAELILEGIHDVVPPGTIELLRDVELEFLVNGSNELSAQTLIEGISVSEVETSPVVRWLEEVIAEWNDDMRFRFNEFVTGSKFPPMTDGPWIGLRIDRTVDVDRLPTSQTCFRTVAIPNYSSKDILKRKLELGVTENTLQLT